MQFHEQLKSYRKERGLTQEELAQKIYVSRSAVAKWENGLGLPNDDSLNALAAVFGVDSGELLGDRGIETIFVRSQKRKRKHYSLVNIVIPLILACVYIVLGIGAMILTLAMSATDRTEPAAVFELTSVLFSLFGLPSIAFGLTQLILAANRIRYRVREKKADKSDIYTTATILDYKTVNYLGRRNKRFSFTLSYLQYGKEKTFMTKALFDINEVNYLKSLDQIKIAVDGNFVVVAEPFPEDIYINPKYDTETAFKQSVDIITLRIVSILCAIGLLFLLVSLVAALLDGIYVIMLMIAAITFATIHIPCAIIILICLIKHKFAYI